MIQESKSDRALLTKSEFEWLLGNTHVSKGYERRIRFSIRNKIQTLREFELPLLIDKGLMLNQREAIQLAIKKDIARAIT